MFLIDRCAAVLKPTEAFLAWLKSSDDDLPELTLAQLRSNCSVFLLPPFDTPEEAVAYVGERYEKIFAAELAAWLPDEPEALPKLDLETFWAFFELEVHDAVLDLEEGDLEGSAVADTHL